MTDRTTLQKMAATRGRKVSKPAEVPSVETLPCSSGGLHVLTNEERVTLCAGCRATWQDLDAAVRSGEVTPPGPDCETCGSHLITRHVWRGLSDEERRAARLDGVLAHNGTLCNSCYQRASKEAS